MKMKVIDPKFKINGNKRVATNFLKSSLNKKSPLKSSYPKYLILCWEKMSDAAAHQQIIWPKIKE